MTEEVTEQQVESMMRDFVESKSNKHSFLTKVVQDKDTTKVGNLTDEELGSPNLELRGVKELELFARDVCSDDDWANYFKNLGEIHTATSLSKDAMLLRLAGTDKKELADVSPMQKKENKGWFKKKE